MLNAFHAISFNPHNNPISYELCHIHFPNKETAVTPVYVAPKSQKLVCVRTETEAQEDIPTLQA